MDEIIPLGGPVTKGSENMGSNWMGMEGKCWELKCSLQIAFYFLNEMGSKAIR